MTENDPAAPTPGANNPPAGEQLPRAPPAQQPGNQPDQTPFIMNQGQFNARWGEKLSSLEKELGVSLEDAKALIASAKEAEDAKKGEVQKLTETNQGLAKDLASAKSELMILKTAIDAQIPIGKLSKVLKYVKGSTEEEIKASIAEIKVDMGLTDQQQPTSTAAQGAGQTGVQSPPPGKKIWTEKEVLDLQANNPDEYRKHRTEILEQMSKRSN